MITIRTESAEDIAAVRRVNELAFGQPGFRPNRHRGQQHGGSTRAG
jgi:hypothetical protein